MALTIVTGYRLEDLFDALVERLAAPASDPLANETVLVPGQGIARWLELRLAERLGIAAGIEMPFLSSYLQTLCAAPDDAGDRFRRDVLVFRLWRILSEAQTQTGPDGDPPFGPASAYCRGDDLGVNKLQLCLRLAARFDDYQLYRPDLLQAFAAGDDRRALSPHAPWQARLWRALLEDAGLGRPPSRHRRKHRDDLTPPLFSDFERDDAAPAAGDRAHRLATLNRRLDDDDWCRQYLPERLFAFGVTTVPQAFLELLHRIAERLPVHLFVPQPTPHYTGDLRQRGTTAGEHALLARFGAESRDFQGMLLDLEDRGPVEHIDLVDLSDDPPPTSLLQCLQRDLVHAYDRGSGAAGRFRLRPDDASLRVHDCHSPERELEVVRDQICRAFRDDPSLEARDVLVLVPDIDQYAPYAHAVFGPLANRLPFHLADRHPARELPICRALLHVLELADSRLGRDEVLHLLDDRAVQRRFGLFAGDVDTLRHLCRTAGIRWGLDADSRRERFDLPPFDDNAWQSGLRRLLLGTLTGPTEQLVLGHLPLADTTESRGELLARFLTFTRTLFQAIDGLQEPRPLTDWADRIEELMAALFAPAGSGADDGLRHLQRCMADLRRTAQLAEHRTAVGLPVVRTWLLDALAQGAPSRGFLGGSITIAAMRPMRAVPVRCLFLCGLDDESFPRRDRPLPFDLIAAKPRPGDRSRRLDDRQLFLDLLLAARDRLHLTFVGHSAKDNSEGAPSVVLSELLDHVDRTCVTDDARTPRELVAVTHPLQPWSPRYHDGRDPRLFTFSLLDPPARSATPPSPWCKPHETLGAPPDDDDTIALDDLLTFWANPCRHFLTRTLQVLVQDDDDDIGDDEPFVVDNRSRWQLQQALVQRAQRGEPEPDNAFARVRQQGVLPVGAHGEAAWQQLRTEVEPLLRAARQHAEAHARAIDVTVSLAADAPPVRLVGEFDGFTEDHLLWLRAGSQRPQDLLSTWVMHLAVALQRHRQPDPGDEAPPWPRTTVLQFRDQRRRYQEVDGRAAERHLATLIRWYREGLTRPLPFFPQASNAAGEKLGPRPDRAEALRAGRSRYEIQRPNQAYRYDLSDQAIALCMRDRDPFADGENGEFVRIAADIWPPAIACLQEERS